MYFGKTEADVAMDTAVEVITSTKQEEKDKDLPTSLEVSMYPVPRVPQGSVHKVANKIT